jgi:hypothetical protein
LELAREKEKGERDTTWRRAVHSEALDKGKSWTEGKRMAGSRTRGRCFVAALCPLRDGKNW